MDPSLRYAVVFLTLLARFLIGPPRRFHPFTAWLIFSMIYPNVSANRFVMGRSLFLLTTLAEFG